MASRGNIFYRPVLNDRDPFKLESAINDKSVKSNGFSRGFQRIRCKQRIRWIPRVYLTDSASNEHYQLSTQVLP